MSKIYGTMTAGQFDALMDQAHEQRGGTMAAHIQLLVTFLKKALSTK